VSAVDCSLLVGPGEAQTHDLQLIRPTL